MSAGIISTGKYIPKIKITNDLVSKKLKISKQKILEKTGIKTRYFASKKESLSFMAVQAAKKAIRRTNIKKDSINLVICCNFEAEYKFPCLASKIVKELNLNNCGSFDINANCTGFQIGLTLACEKIKFDKSINNRPIKKEIRYAPLSPKYSKLAAFKINNDTKIAEKYIIDW